MTQVILRASNGAKILVWLVDDIFSARRTDMPEEQPQTCLGLDLFEIVADLAGLSLENGAEAAEAIELAGRAQRQLADPSGTPQAPIGAPRDEEEPPAATRFHRE